MANLFNLSCDIVYLKYNFNSFNFGKLLLEEETVTRIVNNNRYLFYIYSHSS